ncbi:BnaC06g27470D, partial [Brassica napus]
WAYCVSVSKAVSPA